MSADKTVEIAKGIYWVGGDEHNGGLHCNPYLIVDEDEAVLIDPGSVLDFEYVFDNVHYFNGCVNFSFILTHC